MGEEGNPMTNNSAVTKLDDFYRTYAQRLEEGDAIGLSEMYAEHAVMTSMNVRSAELCSNQVAIGRQAILDEIRSRTEKFRFLKETRPTKTELLLDASGNTATRSATLVTHLQDRTTWATVHVISEDMSVFQLSGSDWLLVSDNSTVLEYYTDPKAELAAVAMAKLVLDPTFKKQFEKAPLNTMIDYGVALPTPTIEQLEKLDAEEQLNRIGDWQIANEMTVFAW